MAEKILVCVSIDQATATIWRGRRFGACTRFANSEEGIGAFSAFLRSTRRSPVHIVVDTVDEDYRFESLPHASGGERTQMVERKLRQVYRTTSFFSYGLQDRDTGKRKDDRYLFAALTNTELLTPWLKAIESLNIPVSGIFLMPMVTESLIERLRLKEQNLLIISKNAAGLRQTFFKDLKFRISRLTPNRGAQKAADEFYADEVGNTRMYLDALTVTHVDDILNVVILDQDGSLASLPKAIRRDRPNMQCRYLSPADIQERFKIRTNDLDTTPDALHLLLLGERMPRLNLAPAAVRRTYQTFSARRWVYVATGATLVVGVAWAGINTNQLMQLDQRTGEMQRETQDYLRKYQVASAQFPAAPASTENLRRTVELAQRIGASLRTPETMYSVIGLALQETPEVQLTRIEWHYGDDAPQLKTLTLRNENATPDVYAKSQIGILQAEIRPFDGDYPAAMKTINVLMSRIAKHTSVAEVAALKLPLDVRSDAGLAGTTTGAIRPENASFQIAVIFKSGA